MAAAQLGLTALPSILLCLILLSAGSKIEYFDSISTGYFVGGKMRIPFFLSDGKRDLFPSEN
jgi:hypothetical protein